MTLVIQWLKGQTMLPDSSRVGSPVEQLQGAWCDAAAKTSGDEMLGAFHVSAGRILDATGITRSWPEESLPGYRKSPYEMRGLLPHIRPWRVAFFRFSIGAHLAALFEKGLIPVGRRFWLEVFPLLWQRVACASEPPPLAPSRLRPADAPFAGRRDYQDWVETELRRRVGMLRCGIDSAIRSIPYDPSRPPAVEAWAHALTAASAILLADKLGLGEDGDDQGLACLSLAWLDSSVGDPFSFRYRGDRQLWPDWKYVYVDLCLAPIYCQVLEYREDGWASAPSVRSLPLKEGSTRTTGDTVTHSGLRRPDIELAVWCEVAGRIGSHAEPMAGHGSVRAPRAAGEGSPMNQLPLHFRRIADKLRQAVTAHGQAFRGGRFAFPEEWPSNDVRKWLVRPEWQLGDGVTLIPAELATPVLEDDVLRINLDWEWLAPEAGWMDLRLMVLEHGQHEDAPSWLEYEDISDDAVQSLVVLRLHGEVWQRLRKTRGRSSVEADFGRLAFARRDSGLGTGVIVVGLVDLSM